MMFVDEKALKKKYGWVGEKKWTSSAFSLTRPVKGLTTKQKWLYIFADKRNAKYIPNLDKEMIFYIYQKMKQWKESRPNSPLIIVRFLQNSCGIKDIPKEILLLEL